MNKQVIKAPFTLKASVKQLENKNQFVIEYISMNKRFLAFQSYKTLICIYCPSDKKLFVNWSMWDYSKTTLKHLKIFINEYTSFDYYDKQHFLKMILTNDNVVLFNE